MTTGDLPPRPDPWTGLPDPPPAPGPRSTPPARRMPVRPKPPPEGRGPVLAGTSGDRRDAVVLLSVGLLAVVAFVAFLGLGPSASPGAWGAVVLLVLVLVAWARSIAVQYLAVGADWLQSQGSWVDLYDLVDVRVMTGAFAQPRLRLRDGAGRRVERYVRELRRDPLMWDLIHLGVRWSRAEGELRTDPRAELVVGDDPLPGGAVSTRRPRVEVSRVVREDPITEGLPSRPDRWTGQPLPPPAPWTSARAEVRFPRRPQTPPPERGPVLAGRSGFRARGVAVVSAAAAALLALLVATVGQWLVHDVVDAVVYGGCFGLVVVGLGWGLTASYVAAGPDWAADERSWVDLTDLVAFRLVRGRWGVRSLELTDGSGRRVRVPLRDLHDDLLLGRLVHLGIRWSRATLVVEIDDTTRAFVETGRVPGS